LTRGFQGEAPRANATIAIARSTLNEKGASVITPQLPGQAAIAAVHDEATRAEETDWPQIVVLYSLLKRVSDNPMVTLNHAIAAAMVHSPATGLKLLEVLDADARMAGHYRLDAVRAHLFEMAGDHLSAIAHYRAAARRTTSIPERDYLTTQAARLAS
jgi:predicted RNA polymerase sigma factor